MAQTLDIGKLISESLQTIQEGSGQPIDKADQYKPGQKVLAKGNSDFSKKDIDSKPFWTETSLGAGYAAKRAMSKTYNYDTSSPLKKY